MDMLEAHYVKETCLLHGLLQKRRKFSHTQRLLASYVLPSSSNNLVAGRCWMPDVSEKIFVLHL